MKISKKILVVSASAVILSNLLVPSVVNAKVNSNNIVVSNSNTENIENSMPYLNKEQLDELGKIISSKMNTTVNSDGDTIQTLSDNEFYKALKQVDPSFNTPMINPVKAGTTKIIWHGAAKKGNFDLYLSASTLNLVKKELINGGVNAACYTLASIAGLTGLGIAWSVIVFALKKLITNALNDNIKHYKAGRVFTVRGWNYTGWRYQ